MTTEKIRELCPAVDSPTLLQFQNDALRAWMMGPPNQDEYWVREYSAITNILALSSEGPVTLDLR